MYGFWNQRVFFVLTSWLVCVCFIRTDINVDTLLVNEIAPRPHNSGHYTIEACPTMSQYKAQLLSILGLMPSYPSGTISMPVSAAVMLNILGGKEANSHEKAVEQAVALPNVALHMYGKASKPARKIGHVTLVAASMAEAEKDINPLIATIDDIRVARKTPSLWSAGAPPAKAVAGTQPLVAVVMGSDSDLPTMRPGLVILSSMNIPFTVSILSAHRTARQMMAFALSAADNGYKVIIAGAGGAAHLPGMIASETTLPVIGVPVRASVLDGLDSLLSIVQMPRGVPVATVGVSNSTNAALLACRILGTRDERVRKQMEAYMKDMEEGVLDKVEVMKAVGWEKYGLDSK